MADKLIPALSKQFIEDTLAALSEVNAGLLKVYRPGHFIREIMPAGEFMAHGRGDQEQKDHQPPNGG